MPFYWEIIQFTYETSDTWRKEEEKDPWASVEEDSSNIKTKIFTRGEAK